MQKHQLFVLSAVVLIGGLFFLSDHASGAVFREIGPRGNLSGTFAVSRSYPRLIVHLDEGVVNVSEDSGESWNAIPAPPQVYSCDLIASPWTRRELFICNSSAVYYCDEFSGVWTDRSPPDYLPDSEERQFLRADPSVPGRLILFYCDGLGFLKLFETLDRGVSWHALPVPPGIFQPVGFTIPEPSGQALLLQLRQGIILPTFVFLTDDLGGNWRFHITPDGNPFHVCRVMNGWIWGTTGLIYKKPWMGGEWQHVQTPGSAYYLEFIYGTDLTMVTGYGNRLYVSEDSGMTWIERCRFREEFWSIFVTSEQWLIRSTNFLRVSTNAGFDFTRSYSGSHSASINAVSFDPFSPGRLYASDDNHCLWISTDNGASWQLSETFPPRGRGSIIPDPNEEGRLYAADDTFSMIMSTDQAASWHIYNEDCPYTNIGYHQFNPETGELLRLFSSGGYSRSPDDSSWTQFFSAAWVGYPDLLIIDPVLPNIWHLFLSKSQCGTDVEYLERSTDGGLSWSCIFSSNELILPFSQVPLSPNKIIGRMNDPENEPRLMTMDLNTLEIVYREHGGATSLVFLEAYPDQFIYGEYCQSESSICRSSPYRKWGTPIVSGLDETIRKIVVDPSNPDRFIVVAYGLYELILTDHDPPGKPTVQSVVPRYSFVEFTVSIPSDATGIKLYTGDYSGEYDACRIAGRDELEAGPISVSADPDVLLWYRISCYDADGNEGEWTEEASVRVRSLPENAPKILVAGYWNTRIREGDRSGRIAVLADDPQGISDVTEILVCDSNGNPIYTLHDDGSGVDPYAGDGFFITLVDPISVPSGYYRFQAVDSHGDRSDYAPLLSVKGDSR